MNSDYGEIRAIPIKTGDDFWSLISTLENDKSGLYMNRNTIVEQYKNGNLFGLRVNETDSMYERGARTDPIFCRNICWDYSELSWYLLPCFLTKIGNTVEICWVHSKARRLGLGKK